MDQIIIIFTKNNFNPLSWLIRWALPRSRFALALSSHCFIDCGTGTLFHALAPKGVQETKDRFVGHYDTVVKKKIFNVTDKRCAIEFLRSQLNKKYDYKGALGLFLSATRDWNEDDKWFCYELAAAALKAAGRNEFEDLIHINEIPLMTLHT